MHQLIADNSYLFTIRNW